MERVRRPRPLVGGHHRTVPTDRQRAGYGDAGYGSTDEMIPLEALEEAAVVPAARLGRHQVGDWGEVPPEDAAEDELSVKQGFRILSAYTLPTRVKVWIITEADRSATTLLLPSEY